MEKINFTVKDIKTANFGINDVVVKDVYPPLVNETVIPTKEQQVLTHEGEYGYDKVTVEPIPDEYIIPEGTLPITENTTYDVRRYSRVSANVKPAPELQDKEVTPTKETQNITFDTGFDGLGNVEVNPIPDEYIIPNLQTKEITPTKNTHVVTPDNEYDALDSVVVNPIPDEYIIPTLQNKEAIPTKETQTIEADETFTGLKTVQIKPIPDEYIIPNGQLEITETGIHDVTNYEEVNVNINAAEDLSEELTEYNEELTTQEVTIDDIVKALQNKILGGEVEELNATEEFYEAYKKFYEKFDPSYNKNYDTNGPVTLYTPASGYSIYFIIYRNSTSYQVMWTQDTSPLGLMRKYSVASSNYIFWPGKTAGISTTLNIWSSGKKAMATSPYDMVTYGTTNSGINYYLSPTYTTVEECIEAMKKTDTVYTKGTSQNTYVAFYTTRSCVVVTNGIDLGTGNRINENVRQISSNENIVVIGTEA